MRRWKFPKQLHQHCYHSLRQCLPHTVSCLLLLLGSGVGSGQAHETSALHLPQYPHPSIPNYNITEVLAHEAAARLRAVQNRVNNAPTGPTEDGSHGSGSITTAESGVNGSLVEGGVSKTVERGNVLSGGSNKDEKAMKNDELLLVHAVSSIRDRRKTQNSTPLPSTVHLSFAILLQHDYNAAHALILCLSFSIQAFLIGLTQSQIWRHGDRAPIFTFPTDPNKEDAWPQGFGQLTTRGMAQHVQLGKFLRKRYINELGFLSPRYKAKEIFVSSTDTNRTIQSAMSNMVGMWSGGSQWGLDYPDMAGGYSLLCVTRPSIQCVASSEWPPAYVAVPIHNYPYRKGE